MEKFGNGFGDHFKEDIVTPRSAIFQNVLYILCWVVVIVFGVYAFLMLQVVTVQFSFPALMIFLVTAAVAVLVFIYKDRVKVEYEYTFTNGTLDFARVYRAVKRQELGSMNVRNVTACGHVAHESFQRYLSMKDVEKKNWFLNRDAELYYFFFSKDSAKKMIILEPSEEMVQLIKQYIPRGVYQEN